jgi:hypothetical protein
MDLQIFKEKNNNKAGKGSGIFEYSNLRDFEKVLFLELNVKELIQLLKRKDNYIKEVLEQLDRVIEDNEESRQVKALKAEITNNQRVILKYKTLYQEQLAKIKL